jgi:hypothetical protein
MPSSTVDTGRARGVLAGVLLDLPPVTLSEVLAAASLQTRVDRKYLLTPGQFDRLAAALRGRFHALEIGGRRMFGYESVYFDTPDLALYRAHRQGRRRRYKARTRTYLDSDECMFEVKLEGRRGETVKRRLPYAPRDRDVLTPAARAFLDETLAAEYGMTAAPLTPALTTTYHRSTLVDLAGGARLTCDVDLVCADDRLRAPGPERVLVESKSTGSGSVADAALGALGIRPIGISKYCVGVALLHPHEPANRWNRTLRQEFGWRPRRSGASSPS